MNKFEKQLEKWNNGSLRGAQAKLAKCLQVTTATVALWATGKRHPSKGYIAQMARLFALDEHAVEGLFFFSPPSTISEQHNWTSSIMWTLRDSGFSDFSMQGSSMQAKAHNLVALPVFTKMPSNYPQDLMQCTSKWWHIPVDFAAGVDFLFILPTKRNPQRLLAIHYTSSWNKGKPMLVQQGNKYYLVQVERIKPSLHLKPLENATDFQQAVPVGTVKWVIDLF